MTPEGILETCVYARDLKAAKGFYQQILGLELVTEEHNRHVFFRCGNSMFLVFNPRDTQRSDRPSSMPEIPTHGAEGEGHAAFRVSPGSLQTWKDHLEDHGVLIERQIDWPNGAISVYFRDPANNSIELATPSLWNLDS